MNAAFTYARKFHILTQSLLGDHFCMSLVMDINSSSISCEVLIDLDCNNVLLKPYGGAQSSHYRPVETITQD